MVAFQGGHPPFKGDSPYLCSQRSWAESSPTRSKVLPLRRGGWVPRVVQAGPEQKKPNRRARCMQPPSGYEHSSAFAQTSGRKGGQPCRRHATAPNGRAPPTSNAPSMGAHTHASRNRRAGCYVQATAPPLAPLPRLLDCGTSTATRGDPAYDPAVPARRDGQYGQKWAGSNGGGRRAGAAVTSSAKLTSHPGQWENPPSRREDGAPVFRSSNGSRTRNGRPVNRSPRRINSVAGKAAPPAGEASDASPSPQ
jgi:hypothetical protein